MRFRLDSMPVLRYGTWLLGPVLPTILFFAGVAVSKEAMLLWALAVSVGGLFCIVLPVFTVRPPATLVLEGGVWIHDSVFGKRELAGPTAAGRTLGHTWVELDGHTFYGSPTQVRAVLDEPARMASDVEITPDGFVLEATRETPRVPFLFALLSGVLATSVGALPWLAFGTIGILQSPTGVIDLDGILLVVMFGFAAIVELALLVFFGVTGFAMDRLLEAAEGSSFRVELLGRVLRTPSGSITLDPDTNTELRVRGPLTLVIRSGSGTVAIPGAPAELATIAKLVERVAAGVDMEGEVPDALRRMTERSRDVTPPTAVE